jgi:hypothetical protein
MDKKLQSVILTLVAVLAIFIILIYVGGNIMGIESLQTGENPLMRFIFVIIGLLIVLGVYAYTKNNKIWVVGTREVVYMSIGAALYAIFSYLFNGTVFVVPSVSQVSLRPAIVIPMFFGYTFGPVVGFFTGAVGNIFGDALTGFGLSPQWSIGNGLVGFIAGMVWLFRDKQRSLNTILGVSTAVVVLSTVIYFLFRNTANMLFFDPGANIFGDAQISTIAGISVLIGYILVLIVYFSFRNNVDVRAAVMWGMLGNLLGIGFAALSDIWINGFSFPVAIVGEFIPSAGPNLIFAAILLPVLVIAYASVRRQSGR